MFIHMSSKGQIIIPAAIRKKLKLTPQTPIQVIEQDGNVLLQPITRTQIDKVKGILKGSGVLAEFFEDRKRERESEERRFEKWSRVASSTHRR